MTNETETMVFWDIYRCSVPSAEKAKLVAPTINSMLKELGYSGPITMTAVGILTRVPINILQAVYSSGVSLTYVDTEISGITTTVFAWGYDQEPLGKHDNIVLLSTDHTFVRFVSSLQNRRHELIQPLSNPTSTPLDPWNPLQLLTWKNFVDILPAGSPSPPLPSPGWHCSTCCLGGQAFEDLVSHLKENHVTHRGYPDTINTWPCLPKRNKTTKKKRISSSPP